MGSRANGLVINIMSATVGAGVGKVLGDDIAARTEKPEGDF